MSQEFRLRYSYISVVILWYQNLVNLLLTYDCYIWGRCSVSTCWRSHRIKIASFIFIVICPLLRHGIQTWYAPRFVYNVLVLLINRIFARSQCFDRPWRPEDTEDDLKGSWNMTPHFVHAKSAFIFSVDIFTNHWIWEKIKHKVATFVMCEGVWITQTVTILTPLFPRNICLYL